MAEPPRKRLLFGLSPWLLVGVSVVLALAILVLSLRNTERERLHSMQNFLDRAEALIWALEAGARTGMAGIQGRKSPLQPLIEETARQPGILYMAVIDTEGWILAHSNPEKVGTRMEAARLPPDTPEEASTCKLSKRPNETLFEVYRGFAPLRINYHQDFTMMGRGHGRHGMMMRTPPDASGLEQSKATSYAFVGFDQQPFLEAFAADSRNNMLTGLLVAMLGLGGCISLFWAHSYRSSRQKLKDTQAFASEVVTSLPLGLIASEPSGKINMINASALSLLHVQRENVAGSSVNSLPGLDWDAITSSLADRQKVHEREMQLVIQDGKRMPVSVSASQIRGDDGVFLGHLFILRDIAEMKKLQAELRKNERLTTLGNLAAGVAHEIRNPLSSIKGLATYIERKTHREGTASPEEEAAKTMILEVNRLNGVVSELLEFARPSAIKLGRADINEVVNRALRLSESDLRSKNIQVQFHPDPTFSGVPINAERLTQALLNLFLNAVHAMQAGGELKVELERRPEEEYAMIISDNGEGMSKETLASLFTPYYTTRPSGTGLGLAIVHQIIEGHGGRIMVSSEQGKGSTFTLILPMNPASPGYSGTAQAKP